MKLLQTTPLTKLFLTTEGFLVVAFNACIGAAAVFGSLPGVQAMKWAGIVNAATIISRQGLKAIAALGPVFGKPIIPAGLPPSLTDVPADKPNPELWRQARGLETGTPSAQAPAASPGPQVTPPAAGGAST